MRENPLPVPKNLRREVQAGWVLIQRTWRTRELWILIPFTLFWDGFLLLWYFMAFTKADTPLLMILFPIVHVLFGLGLTWLCIATLFNTTTLAVSPDLVRITTGPIPTHREINLAPVDIRDVFYREKANRGYSSTYHVIALTKSNEEKILFKNLGHYDEARFYVQELRTLLSLSDTAPTSRE